MNRFLARIAVLTCLTIPASLSVAEDWPTFQRSVTRNAWTNEALPTSQLGLLWKADSSVPPSPAWGRPAKWDAYAGIRDLQSMRNYDPVFHVAVASGRVYFGSSTDDTLRCLNANTGKTEWQFTVDGPIRIAPTVADGKVYFGADDGFAYCLDADSGAEVWRFRPAPDDREILNNGRLISRWPCRTGVAVVGNHAYFAMSLVPWNSSYLCAVDARDGSSTQPGCFVQKVERQTMEGPLVISPQFVIVPQGRVAPQMFRRDDGKPLGALTGGGGSFVVLTSDDNIVHGPGNKTGWLTSSRANTREKVASYQDASAIIVRGPQTYLLTKDWLVASEPSSKRVLWKTENRESHAMVLSRQTLFVGRTDEVVGIDIRSGRQVWRYPVAGRAAGLAISGGKLYVSTDQGSILCFAESGSPPKATPPDRSPTLPVTIRRIPPTKDDSLFGQWVFQHWSVTNERLLDLGGRNHAKLTGKLRLESSGSYQAAVFDQRSPRVVLASPQEKPDLPAKEMSVEAWVRVDQPQRWGGIIGYIQDNGSYERGWILGFENDQPSFALAAGGGENGLTYLPAKTRFQAGKFRHVAGVYDGKAMKIFVDGKLENTSLAQTGEISYPPQSFFEIGAYHDSNEDYRLQGRIQEVRLYGRALTDREVAAHAQSRALQASSLISLPVEPVLRFTNHNSASVRWETKTPMACRLVLDTVPPTTFETPAGTVHTVNLTNLPHKRILNYWIEQEQDDDWHRSKVYECDTYFNFVPAVLGNDQTGATSELGLAVLVGFDDDEQLDKLLKSTRYRWLVLDDRPEKVLALRERLVNRGMYGHRIAARLVTSYDELPLIDTWANLLISNRSPNELQGGIRAVAKLVRPGGEARIAASQNNSRDAEALNDLGTDFNITAEKGILKLQRKPLPGAGAWSHLYGLPNNAAFGGEQLAGARTREDLEIQWLGRPGARYQPDRNGRKPSPLSAGGRLFLQGLERIIALDAFNGTILWSCEMPGLGRFNMPRDCSNWCVDEDSVFVAIGPRCVQFDAATGKISTLHQIHQQSAASEDPYHWGYLARVDNLLVGTEVKAGAQFTSYWGGANAGWYDARSGDATHKVCSDRLFVLEDDSANYRWQYDGSVIVNSTITIEGGQVLFVENRDPKLQAAKTRRFGDELWSTPELVSLDLETGRERWRAPLDIVGGRVMLQLAASRGKVALVASGADKKYHVYTFGLDDGKPAWNAAFPWPSDNHGGHMARPAIVGNRLLVRPRVFQLDTGKVDKVQLPMGGCGTYACSTNAVFFRSRTVTMWNPDKGSVSGWPRLRPDCWLSTIPASGMLLSPEGGGGCSCGIWMETSIGFIPKRKPAE